jgi:hypothetical protein
LCLRGVVHLIVVDLVSVRTHEMVSMCIRLVFS